jgi:hypothetical protein
MAKCIGGLSTSVLKAIILGATLVQLFHYTDFLYVGTAGTVTFPKIVELRAIFQYIEVSPTPYMKFLRAVMKKKPGAVTLNGVTISSSGATATDNAPIT